MAVTIANTNFANPWKNGYTELVWVTWSDTKTANSRSPISAQRRVAYTVTVSYQYINDAATGNVRCCKITSVGRPVRRRPSVKLNWWSINSSLGHTDAWPTSTNGRQLVHRRLTNICPWLGYWSSSTDNRRPRNLNGVCGWGRGRLTCGCGWWSLSCCYIGWTMVASRGYGNWRWDVIFQHRSPRSCLLHHVLYCLCRKYNTIVKTHKQHEIEQHYRNCATM